MDFQFLSTFRRFKTGTGSESKWVSYRGPRDGRGWRNTVTGEIRYQEQMPDDSSSGDEAEGEQPAPKPKDDSVEFSLVLKTGEKLPKLKYRENVTAEEFVEAREKVRASDKGRSGFLSKSSPDDLRGSKFYLTEDGKVGMVVSPDGDAQNLFSISDVRYAGLSMLIDVLEEGNVKTADCYAGFLPEMYTQCGFVETGRMDFNEEYMPDDWNLPRDNHPDVVFLRLAKKRSREEIFRDVAKGKQYWIHERSEKRYKDGEWDEAKADSRRTEVPSGAGRKSGDGNRPPVRPNLRADSATRTGYEPVDRRRVRVPGGLPLARELDKGQPIRELPTKVKVPGVGTVTAGPLERARDVAREYMKAAGMDYAPPTTYAKVDEARAKKIAEAYEQMEHQPNDPEVKAAFEQLFKETVAQWKAIEKSGLKITWIKAGDKDPYAKSPRLATEDIRKNNHLAVFTSDKGFGSSDSDVNKQNIALQPSGVKIAGRDVSNVELFRIVHDYFGHAKEGVGFRADGEENAWRQHAAMFSELARKAMTVATRGQNSWVNFGPHGESNRKSSSEKTVYADQKIGLLPDWVHRDGAFDDYKKAGVKKMSTANKWVPYLGVYAPNKGKHIGWKNIETGDVRYQDEMPGDIEPNAPAGTETSLVPFKLEIGQPVHILYDYGVGLETRSDMTFAGYQGDLALIQFKDEEGETRTDTYDARSVAPRDVKMLSEASISAAQEIVDDLNKLREKKGLGGEPYSIEVLDHSYMRKHEMITTSDKFSKPFWADLDKYQAAIKDGRVVTTGKFRDIALVRIKGSEPKFDGWEFISKLSPMVAESGVGRNLVMQNPKATIETPVEYRKAIGICEHCGKKRMRSETFVLHKDGEFICVGRQCLKDFLGGHELEPHLRRLELLQKWEDLGIDPEEDEGEGSSGGRVRSYWDLEKFMEVAASAIRQEGFAPTSANRSTRGIVTYALDKPFSQRDYKDWLAHRAKYEPNEKDKELARAAIEWARSIPENDPNNYLANLGLLAFTGRVDNRGAGLAASLITAYARANGIDIATGKKADSTPKLNEHIGKVGERVPMNLRVTGVRSFEARDFRTGQSITKYAYSFADKDGRSLVWFTESEKFNPGDEVTVKATITKHDEYKGTKQTVVNRVEEYVEPTKLAAKDFEVKSYTPDPATKTVAVFGFGSRTIEVDSFPFGDTRHYSAYVKDADGKPVGQFDYFASNAKNSDVNDILPAKTLITKLKAKMQKDGMTKMSTWVKYTGPRGGKGWRNTETGDVRYQKDMPDDGGSDVKSFAGQWKTVPTMYGDEIRIRRAPNFELEGSYDIEYNGRSGRIFRDPENGWWYIDGSNHGSQRFIGVTKTEALEYVGNEESRWMMHSKETAPTSASKSPDDYFNAEAVNSAKNESVMSRETLIYMSPDDFLKMAAPLEDGPVKSKESTVEGVLARGEKFEDVPYLGFAHDGKGRAVVESHEGRHRAMALKKRGVTSMPVRFVSRETGGGPGIRWGVQSDASRAIKGAWPESLIGEDGVSTIDFPVKDSRHVESSSSSTVLQWAERRYGSKQSAENFAKWFGDSKVVDGKGQPLVVYHGTAANFDEFEPYGGGDYGVGLYFTNRPEAASEYSRGYQQSEYVDPSDENSYRHGARVIPSVLRMSNPLEITRRQTSKMWDDFIGKKEDGEVPEEMHLTEWMKSKGYDGIIVSGLSDADPDLRYYIVFEGNQVKSAMTNNGGFSNSDARINMSSWDLSGYRVKRMASAMQMAKPRPLPPPEPKKAQLPKPAAAAPSMAPKATDAAIAPSKIDTSAAAPVKSAAKSAPAIAPPPAKPAAAPVAKTPPAAAKPTIPTPNQRVPSSVGSVPPAGSPMPAPAGKPSAVPAPRRPGSYSAAMAEDAATSVAPAGKPSAVPAPRRPGSYSAAMAEDAATSVAPAAAPAASPTSKPRPATPGMQQIAAQAGISVQQLRANLDAANKVTAKPAVAAKPAAKLPTPAPRATAPKAPTPAPSKPASPTAPNPAATKTGPAPTIADKVGNVLNQTLVPSNLVKNIASIPGAMKQAASQKDQVRAGYENVSKGLTDLRSRLDALANGKPATQTAGAPPQPPAGQPPAGQPPAGQPPAGTASQQPAGASQDGPATPGGPNAPASPQSPTAPQGRTSKSITGSFVEGFQHGFGAVMKPVAKTVLPSKVQKLLTNGPLGKASAQIASSQAASQSQMTNEQKLANKQQERAQRDAEKKAAQQERQQKQEERAAKQKEKRVGSAARRIEKLMGFNDYFAPGKENDLKALTEQLEFKDVVGDLDHQEVLDAVKARRDQRAAIAARQGGTGNVAAGQTDQFGRKVSANPYEGANEKDWQNWQPAEAVTPEESLLTPDVLAGGIASNRFLNSPQGKFFNEQMSRFNQSLSGASTGPVDPDFAKQIHGIAKEYAGALKNQDYQKIHEITNRYPHIQNRFSESNLRSLAGKLGYLPPLTNDQRTKEAEAKWAWMGQQNQQRTEKLNAEMDAIRKSIPPELKTTLEGAGLGAGVYDKLGVIERKNLAQSLMQLPESERAAAAAKQVPQLHKIYGYDPAKAAAQAKPATVAQQAPAAIAAPASQKPAKTSAPTAATATVAQQPAAPKKARAKAAPKTAPARVSPIVTPQFAPQTNPVPANQQQLKFVRKMLQQGANVFDIARKLQMAPKEADAVIASARSIKMATSQYSGFTFLATYRAAPRHASV